MRLILHPVFDFSETLAGRALLAGGVGPGARIASLVGEYLPGEPLPPDATFIRGGPSEPVTFATAAIIWDGTGTALRELPLDKVRVRYPFVQPVPDGGVLVAHSRVSAGEEPNAFVFDQTGQLTRRIMFGDGIEHIQVDLDGKAWVGYFDEGIFGNLGWGNPGGPESIGSTGLNRFDLSTGNIEWTFKPPPGAGFDGRLLCAQCRRRRGLGLLLHRLRPHSDRSGRIHAPVGDRMVRWPSHRHRWHSGLAHRELRRPHLGLRPPVLGRRTDRPATGRPRTL